MKNKMENRKVVFLTSRLPFPADCGSKHVMYNFCKILNEKYGMKIIVVSFEDIPYNEKDKPNFIEEVHILKNVGKLTKICNIVKYSIFTSKFPLQVCLYYSKSLKKQIKKILEEEKPDIIISYMVRMAEYLKLYNEAYRVSILEDLLSLRYKRQLKINEESINPYGRFLDSIPKKLHKILLNKHIKKYVFHKEIKLLEKYELQGNNFSDKTVFVAQNEANIYNENTKTQKAMSIPLGVDIEYLSKKISVDKEENSICFIGDMRVAHNDAGVKHFINEIFPIIYSAKNNVKFYVIGTGASEELKKLESDNIIFTGRVDDIRKYVEKCQVFVCPLTFGTGIKTKNLEAMAMRIPIVTTSVGAENIFMEESGIWYIADNNEEFAKDVLKLLDNETMRNEMATKAYDFVYNNFTWKVAENKIGELLKEIF